jgi:IMP dehydrogenase
VRFYDASPSHDLTYSDVFLIPSRGAVRSRLDVDLSPEDVTGMTIPVVSANMNAVTGPRLAAVMARRGGLGVLPQDLDGTSVHDAIAWVKAQPVRCDSPYPVSADATVEEARLLLPPAEEISFTVFDADDALVGMLPAEALTRAVSDARLGDLVHEDPFIVGEEELDDPAAVYQMLWDAHVKNALVERDGAPVGTISQRQAMRLTVYRPALDAHGRLKVAAAIGIRGDIGQRAADLVRAGADVLVVDTAHGHQQRMLDAVARVRAAVGPTVPIAAGNVVTAAGTADLVEAGADLVKVGVGPGAMCTTRMMTAVGRPQFSAVLECAATAQELGAAVWADGGVRYPRDVALALAAGGSSVMIGTWLAGTIESPGEVHRSDDGRLFKVNYGMASTKAVKGRFAALSPLERARKRLFSEGISDSRLWIDPLTPSVEDILDQITAGVRSACTYAGAASLRAFRDQARVGIQSAAGYEEGRALPTSW